MKYRAVIVMGGLAMTPILPVCGQQGQASLDSQVDSIFSAYRAVDLPGCSVAVNRRDTMLLIRTYGSANLEHRIPITPATVFNIQSVSKQFLAAVVVLLAREGALSLEDDIRRYVPELPNYGKPITVRHLLQHTSGLPDVGVLMSLAGWHDQDGISRRQLLDLIVRQRRLNGTPGEQFVYSNSGIVLLEAMVKRVTGKSIGEHMRLRIFEPLGMMATRYRENPWAMIPNRAQGVAMADGAPEQGIDTWRSVATTPSDLIKWARNFATGEVGGMELGTQLTTPARLNSGAEWPYGMGLFLGRVRGHRLTSHGGGGADGRSELAIVPDQQLAVSVLCNRTDADATGLARQVVELLVDPLPPSGAVAGPADSGAASLGPPPSARQLGRYVGTYFNATRGTVRKVVAVGDSLFVEAPEADVRWLLSWVGGGEFRAVSSGPRTRYTFTRAPGTGTVRLRRSTVGLPDVDFVPIPPTTRAPALQAYAGRFYSAELDATIEIRVSNGVLTLALPRQDVPSPLRSLAPDVFLVEGGDAVHFERTSNGRVRTLLYHQNRVWRQTFERR